ncbi:hypothetical protein ACJJIF_21455 [Microbulbifer sp. SSSA002]|uniref:hypothetical protein n=1 Tax=unclassified Microbulbifer TaxID=2619833 RepID=UPI00403A78D6
MKIDFKLLLIAIGSSMMSCTPIEKVSDVYVEDFQTDLIDSCKPSDVDLNNSEVEQFFKKSRKVEYKIIHDHYNVAPCYLEGVLTFYGLACDWKLQPSAIGSIKCNNEVNYYVCDTCEELFE